MKFNNLIFEEMKNRNLFLNEVVLQVIDYEKGKCDERNWIFTTLKRAKEKAMEEYSKTKKGRNIEIKLNVTRWEFMYGTREYKMKETYIYNKVTNEFMKYDIRYKEENN